MGPEHVRGVLRVMSKHLESYPISSSFGLFEDSTFPIWVLILKIIRTFEIADESVCVSH